MKNKFAMLLMAALIAAFSSACALAQPEEALTQDRFAGFYLVASQGYDAHFYDNPNLTQAGEETVDLGTLGTHGFPRQVLYAGEDGSFPGLEGFPLYCLTLEEEHGPVTKVVSTMSDGVSQINASEGKTETVLSGKVFLGPPAGARPDWDSIDSGIIWHAFRVYQDAQGRAYLDGSGNSFNGCGSMEESKTQSVTVGGETHSETVRVTAAVEQAHRLTAVSLLQYREDGSLLENQSLDLSRSPMVVQWHPEAAWAVVAEYAGDQVHPTAYPRPNTGDDPICHTLILLDDQGIGCPTELQIEEPARS